MSCEPARPERVEDAEPDPDRPIVPLSEVDPAVLAAEAAACKALSAEAQRLEREFGIEY